MKEARILGSYISELMDKNNVSKNQLADFLSADICKIDSLLQGRAYLSFQQFKRVADFFSVSPEDLLKGNPTGYASAIGNCMGEFSNEDNREEILDIIDDYIDVLEAVG